MYVVIILGSLQYQLLPSLKLCVIISTSYPHYVFMMLFIMFTKKYRCKWLLRESIIIFKILLSMLTFLYDYITPISPSPIEQLDDFSLPQPQAVIQKLKTDLYQNILETITSLLPGGFNRKSELTSLLSRTSDFSTFSKGKAMMLLRFCT